jgi:3-hydroxyisobutyrate dehydrogenase-like beta-hydroxyacid dehydrogenase
MHDGKIGIIGAGRLGCSAAMALFNKGLKLRCFQQEPESQNFYAVCWVCGLRMT